MRLRVQIILAFVTIAMLSAAISAGEQDTRRNRWSDRSHDSFGLLRYDDVQQELQLSEKQTATFSKLVTEYKSKTRALFAGSPNKGGEERRQFWNKARTEFRKVCNKFNAKTDAILEPKQRERLSQIKLQVRMRCDGPASDLAVDELAKALGLTEKEKQEYLERAATIRHRLAEKKKDCDKQAEDELLGILTEEQRQILDSLTGEIFHLPERRSNSQEGRADPSESKRDRPSSVDGAQ